MSRADRLVGAARRARARLPARHQPRQRPLPDRLHGHQRRGRGHARRAPVPHRLPLRRAGQAAGDGVRAPARPSRELLGDLAARLRGRAGFDDAHVSVKAHRLLAEKAGDGRRAGRRPAAWSSGCARSRTRPSWRRCARRPRARRRGLRAAARRRAWPAAPSARWRARSSASSRTSGADEVVVPADRGRGRARGAAARGAARRRDPARRAGRGRPGRAARRLLLRLHAHVRDRPARRRARPRATRWCAARRRRRSTRCARAPWPRRSTAGPASWSSRGSAIGFDHGLGHGVGLEVHEAPAAGADRGGMRSRRATW